MYKCLSVNSKDLDFSNIFKSGKICLDLSENVLKTV